MQELSLHLLDIAQNSVAAGAKLVVLDIAVCCREQALWRICISDNGCGMDAQTVQKAADPFYTSRTTRKVGMGLALFRMAAELTGGSMQLCSAPGEGTQVTALFYPEHIDAVPMGDLAGTFVSLVQTSPDTDFVLHMEQKGKEPFTMDTRKLRAVLQEVPLTAPQVLRFIYEDIAEQAAVLLYGT